MPADTCLNGEQPIGAPLRYGRARSFLLLWIIATSTVLVHAGPPTVSVEGGPNGLGSSYHWTITNNHTSPIVRVEFPHYRASLFFAPQGWTSSCTNVVAVGAPDAPGVCTATAATTADGIAPGRSATFGMQLASGSIKRGSGEATIAFADSSTQKVGGVLVPVPETFGDRYVPLLGLSGILAVFVVMKALRRRKADRFQADA